MSTCHVISTSVDRSTTEQPPLHTLQAILKTTTNAEISTEARLLYVNLCFMAWSKSYCWPCQTLLAEELGRSVRSVRRLLKELKQAGLLRIEHPIGQPCRYYPLAVAAVTSSSVKGGPPSSDTGGHITLKENVQDVKNVLLQTPVTLPKPKPNVNAFQRPHQEPRKSFSPKPNHRDELVREIEQVTGDTWSTGWFHTLVRNNDQQTVRMALSITRDKLAIESGVNAGAYFTATVKSLAGVQPLHNGPRRHVDEKPQAITPAPIQAVEMRRSVPPVKLPAVKFCEQPEKPNPEHLIKGLRFHWRNEGLSGLLTWTEKSVVGINTREIWAQIKELLPQAREDDLVNRFLQTVHVRLKHQEARAG